MQQRISWSESRRRCGSLAVGSLLLAFLLGSCGEGADPARLAGEAARLGALGVQPAGPGSELEKPGGGTFFLDPNQGGNGATLHIAETFWGRLVDIHDVDATGAERAAPRYREQVIDQNVQSDGVNYSLIESPATRRARLVIHAKWGSERFAELLRAATEHVVPVVPKHDDGRSTPPFTTVARNACLVLRFDDCLDDDAAAESRLPETVKVLAGYPPRTPFGARFLFDPHHGALVDGEFHSTRVLIDLTVSEFEAAGMSVPEPLNILGLPASLSTTPAPNATVRVPTRVDPGSGQFVLLRNLAGVPLTFAEDPTRDASVPTLEVVRALRSGNPGDASNGFLLDLERPRLIGSMPVVVERARSVDGRVFQVDLLLVSPCRLVPRVADVLAAGDSLFEVVTPGVVEPSGRIRKLQVRSPAPIADPASLLGNGLLRAPFDPSRTRGLAFACWLGFLPEPLALPDGVSTSAQVLARFSEPMDPEPARAFDSFLVVRGPAVQGSSSAHPDTIVPGDVQSSVDLDEFAFTPQLPLAHQPGIADPYHVELSGFRDLAGNPLRDELPFVDFRVDPLEAAQSNGGIVLRFTGPDELGPDGLADLRGQFFYDLGRGAIRGRPPVFSSWPVDRTVPVPSLMIPVGFGVSTPLNPLGSKLHSLWRYCDLGWNVRDETKYNVDVVGLNWSPPGGQVISDFFDQFEIRLSHGRFLPDESLDPFLLPRWPQSGLLGGPNLFTDNILVDPVSPQKVVHPKTLGYVVSPANVFTSNTGTPLMPYPLNRLGGPLQSYTWRDTAVLAEAGPNNQGVPMDIETGPPLFLEPQAGTLASAGQVPSIGLPLLMEYRCYPSDRGLGLNALGVSLAVNSSHLPAFRAYSSGGINRFGLPVVVNPDAELSPRGGLNPSSSPPGQPTRFSAENVFYIGQLDLAIRVSRVHTVWLDTRFASPAFVRPLLAPPPDQLPQGTQVILDFRGALGFSAGAAPFDAARLDAYGDLMTGSVSFLNGVSTWQNDVRAVDGARYVQVRLTFQNDLAARTSPELSALALAFSD